MKHLKTIAAFFCLFSIINIQAQTIEDLNDYNEPPSRLRGVIEKFSEDYGSLNRFYTVPASANRTARFRQFYSDQPAFLDKQNFASLNADEQIDYLLFVNYPEHEKRELERYAGQLNEMSALLPFAKAISDLEDARRRLEMIDSAKTAVLLDEKGGFKYFEPERRRGNQRRTAFGEKIARR